LEGIKIVRVKRHPKTRAIMVDYEFDFGRRGTLTFPADATDEEISDYLIQHYQRTKKQKENEKDVKTLIAKLKKRGFQVEGA